MINGASHAEITGRTILERETTCESRNTFAKNRTNISGDKRPVGVARADRRLDVISRRVRERAKKRRARSCCRDVAAQLPRLAAHSYLLPETGARRKILALSFHFPPYALFAVDFLNFAQPRLASARTDRSELFLPCASPPLRNFTHTRSHTLPCALILPSRRKVDSKPRRCHRFSTA